MIQNEIRAAWSAVRGTEDLPSFLVPKRRKDRRRLGYLRVRALYRSDPEIPWVERLVLSGSIR